MKVLFASVIYNNIEEYIEDFIKSLSKQTYKEFDLLIINDGLEDEKVRREFYKTFNNCSILDYCNSGLNPSELRVEIIKYSTDNGYDLLIFGDIDDIFSSNRIMEIVNNYSDEFAFYYNDLIVMDTKKDFFNGKLKNNVKNKDELDNYNFIGMSNSAVNIKLINNVLCDIGSLKGCIAFDWYFYTLLIKLGFCGVKVKDAITYYRIYDNNIAGFTNSLNLNKLNNGIKVKQFQYEALSKYDISFIDKLEKINILKDKMDNEYYFVDKYIKCINNNYKNSVFWWENIRLIDEVEEK